MSFVRSFHLSFFAFVPEFFYWNFGFFMNQRFFDLLENALEGMSRYDTPSSDSQTLKIIAAVALGVGVTAVAGVAVAATIGGFVLLQEDSLRLPWSRLKRPQPLTLEKWNRAFDNQNGSLKANSRKVIGQIRRGGCEPDIRSQVWPFLLGLYEIHSFELERQVERELQRKRYEVLRKQSKILEKKGKECMEKMDVNGIASDALQGKEEDSSLSFIHEDSTDASVVSDPVEERSNESNCSTEAEEKRLNFEKNDSYFSIPKESVSESCTRTGEALITNDSVFLSSESGSVEEGEEEGSPLLPSSTLHKNESLGFKERLEKVQKVLNSEEDLENYATWQRIMRLDAVRMNAAWVPYSSQSEVNPLVAAELARSAQLGEDSHLDSSRRMHAARLVNILEAYAVYDFEIGYCQGMSDLLSPFVALMEDDSNAFWCYQRFMSKARQNYRVDEMGIRNQLNSISNILEKGDPALFAHLERIGAGDCIFVYRMVVVLLRRELSFEQTITLWEILWADALACEMDRKSVTNAERQGGVKRSESDFPPCEELLLYVIAAIVKKNRVIIMQRCSGLDDVMRLCNGLSGNLNIWDLLREARTLFSIVAQDG